MTFGLGLTGMFSTVTTGEADSSTGVHRKSLENVPMGLLQATAQHQCQSTRANNATIFKKSKIMSVTGKHQE